MVKLVIKCVDCGLKYYIWDKMQFPLKAWFVALFLLESVIGGRGASTQDTHCATAVKSLEATMDKRLKKLEADIKAIYLGLNLQGKLTDNNAECSNHSLCSNRRSNK